MATSAAPSRSSPGKRRTKPKSCAAPPAWERKRSPSSRSRSKPSKAQTSVCAFFCAARTSHLDLCAELDDLVRRQREVLRGARGVAHHRGEEFLAPESHAGPLRRD